MQRFSLRRSDAGRHGVGDVMLVVTLVLVGLAGALLLPFLAQAQQDGQSFHSSHSGPKIDYEALNDSAGPLADSQEGQQVLANCLEAYGGVDKLTELNGFRLHYSMTPMMSKESVPVEKTFQRGRKYRMVNGDQKRILNGQKCWYTKGDQVADMDGGRYRSELFSYLTLAMPLAAETERFDEIKFGKRDDDPLSYLYFDKADSLLVILGIDTESHLIKTTTGLIRQDDKHFVFIHELDDYRQVEGFWFPHRLGNISMGLRVGESVLDKVEVNPAFGEKTFLPPEAGR